MASILVNRSGGHSLEYPVLLRRPLWEEGEELKKKSADLNGELEWNGALDRDLQGPFIAWTE